MAQRRDRHHCRNVENATELDLPALTDMHPFIPFRNDRRHGPASLEPSESAFCLFQIGVTHRVVSA
jgi:hypothetical protein